MFSEALGGFRFPHPAEVCYLNTIPLDFVHLPEMRAALCLVGQVAAPLQALWVYSQVRRWAELAFTGFSQVDPNRQLVEFKQLLRRSCKDLWHVPSLDVPCPLWVRQDAALYAVQVDKPVRARDLVAAELALAGPGFKAYVLDDSRRLPPHAFLHHNNPGRPYVVCVQAKKAKADTTANTAGQTPGPSSKTCLEQPVGTSDVAIWAGLMRLQGINQDSPVFVLPPAWVASFVSLSAGFAPASPILWPEDAAVCILPILDTGHWSVLVVSKSAHGLKGAHFDGIPGRSQPVAEDLLQRLARTFNVAVHSFCSTAYWVQTDCYSCGTIALAHAAAFLFGGPSEAILADAASFLACMPQHIGTLYGLGGLSEVQTQKLQEMLLDRGVPKSQIVERVQVAIAKIGAGPIAQALGSSNPWQALKAAGSAPAASFRWIKPEELKAHAEHKATEKFGAAVSNPKSKKSHKQTRGQKQPLQVDPLALQLAPKSFTTEGGEPLAQLGFSEVIPQAQGVSFCTAQQLLPFVQNYQSLSVDALALVATSEIPSDLCAGAPVSSIRFPVIYEPTGEAILLQGSMLQLGDETVQLTAANIAEVETVDVITGRVSLFRDEVLTSWDSIAKAPIRAIIELVPALSLCKDSNCKGDCQHFHPAVDECVENMIVDVWARRFSTVDGSRVDSGKADLFQALIRVPSSALKHLQRTATPGFYFEPRSGDGHTAHAGFSVIWLPGKDRAHVLHIAQTTDRVVAITRINRRFGVRVREADEHAVHKLLKPDVEFVKVRIAARYRLHPLPHGMQRKHLVALLRQWGWSARPLQALKGDASGSAWEVGSDTEPPGQALAAAGSFVLVAKLRDASGQTRVPEVTATPQTRKHILCDDPDTRHDPSQGIVDPWLGGKDPWAAYKPPPGLSAPQPASTADSKLQQVRGELQESFRKQLEDYTAAQSEKVNSSQESRLQKLEVGMTELHEQNRKFQDWCQNLGGQLNAHSNQIGEVQRAVQAQQAEVGQLRTEFTQVVANSVSGLQQDMSRQLASQMQQIESLLSKKPRTE